MLGIQKSKYMYLDLTKKFNNVAKIPFIEAPVPDLPYKKN